jgi:flagella basal body P-ring formation protein FlgA
MLRNLRFGLAALLLSASPSWSEEIGTLIEEGLVTEMGAQMPAVGTFDLTIQGANQDRSYVVLSFFWYDPAKGQYVARGIDEETGAEVSFQGFAILNVPVPVPTRRISPGEIITAADLQTIDVPYARVATYAEFDAEAIDGMVAVRMLATGRPIMKASIRLPVVVARGATVEVKYKKGPLSLTAPGKAMSDAAIGEEVRVVNLISNKSITAVAVGKGEVEVK